MVGLQAELRQFLQTDAKQQEERAAHAPRWQGIVYAGPWWEEGLFGAVLRMRPTVELKEGDGCHHWMFKLGLKAQAAAAPEDWVMYPVKKCRAEDPSRNVAVREQLPAYRLAQARMVTRYICELLDRAKSYEGAKQAAWVRIERDNEVYVATISWNEDSIATVWVLEKTAVFQDPMQETQGETSDDQTR